MYKLLLSLAKKFGKKLTVKHLEEAGIPSANIPKLLHDIIAANDEANISLLVHLDKTIINPYYVNKEGLTPIQVAVNLRRWDHVVGLLKIPQLDHVNARTAYALLEAVKAEEVLIVEHILEYCNDASYYSIDNRYTVIHWAIVKSNAVLLESLLSGGVSPNLIAGNALPPIQLLLQSKPINEKLLTLLCTYAVELQDSDMLGMAKINDWSTIKLILSCDKRPHINLCSLLLIEAIKQENEEAIIYLMSRGVSFFVEGADDKTALMLIKEKGLYRYFDLFIEHDGIKRQQVYSLLLPYLAEAGQWELVKKMIPIASPLFGHEVNNQTTLGFAIVANNLEVMSSILQVKDQANYRFHDKAEYPINIAVRLRLKEATTLLFECGADIKSLIDSASKQKWSDLEFALPLYKTDCKADLENVVLAAAKDNAIECLKLLFSMGVSADSAIRTAVNYGQWDNVKRILSVLPGKHEALLTSIMEKFMDNSSDTELLTLLLDRGVDPFKVIYGDSDSIMYTATYNKWHFALPMATYPQIDLQRAARSLGRVALLAASNGKWDLVQSLMSLTNNHIWSNGDKYLAYYALRDGQLGVLEKLLNNREDVDFASKKWGTVVNLAEEEKNLDAINLLVRHGANHHYKIINAAENSKWEDMYELMVEHYVIRPNSNETDSDKKVLCSKLLHTLARKTVPTAIMKDIVALADINSCEETSGNTLCHLAILHNNPDYLEILLKAGAKTDIKNKAGQTPATLLFTLSKENKLTHAAKLSILLTESSEWVTAHEFERADENIQDASVEAARNISIEALKRRYPNINQEQAIREYRTFLGHLPDDARHQKYKLDSEYKLNEAEIKELVALVWVAANDRDALPVAEEKLKDNPLALDAYVQLRRMSLAEKLYEARHVAKQSGSCSRGTKTKVLEALHNAHPDVIVCYSKANVLGAAREHAAGAIQAKAKLLFAGLNLKEQYDIALFYTSQHDVLPKFYEILRDELANELQHSYSSLLTDEEFTALLEPKYLPFISFAPFTELDRVIGNITTLIHHVDQKDVELVNQLNQLKKQSDAIFTGEMVGVSQEIVKLKEAYQVVAVKVVTQYLGYIANFIKTTDRSQEEVNTIMCNAETRFAEVKDAGVQVVVDAMHEFAEFRKNISYKITASLLPAASFLSNNSEKEMDNSLIVSPQTNL